MQPPLLAQLFITIAGVASLVIWRRSARRKLAVTRLLDAADALETRLRVARAELEAVTGNADTTRDAFQEMLRQRLWLQQHGDSAPLRQLESVCASLEQAREQIERQLSRIERARAPVA